MMYDTSSSTPALAPQDIATMREYRAHLIALRYGWYAAEQSAARRVALRALGSGRGEALARRAARMAVRAFRLTGLFTITDGAE